jgi:hypothetical protein
VELRDGEKDAAQKDDEAQEGLAETQGHANAIQSQNRLVRPPNKPR